MRTHTIGEVLNRLKGEFDDITISKIRFLESEGLITPDRTESGYRKFTEADIDRLRYVLRAQRDRYLPLKVIKGELAQLDAGHPIGPMDDQSTNGEAPGTDHRADDAAAPAPGPGQRGGPSLLETAPTDLALSAADLADAAGVTEADVAALREHGLLGAGPGYDGDDLRVVQHAARLLTAGLEARHLRMYKQFAEREAALAEQLVSPLLRQRNPDSRRAATEQAEHLAEVGGGLHRALLASRLRAMLRP